MTAVMMMIFFFHSGRKCPERGGAGGPSAGGGGDQADPTSNPPSPHLPSTFATSQHSCSAFPAISTRQARGEREDIATQSEPATAWRDQWHEPDVHFATPAPAKFLW